jgi:hypothetical protein
VSTCLHSPTPHTATVGNLRLYTFGRPRTIPFILLTHVFRYDFMTWASHFLFRFRLIPMNKCFYHSCRSLITGAWELELFLEK